MPYQVELCGDNTDINWQMSPMQARTGGVGELPQQRVLQVLEQRFVLTHLLDQRLAGRLQVGALVLDL